MVRYSIIILGIAILLAGCKKSKFVNTAAKAKQSKVRMSRTKKQPVKKRGLIAEERKAKTFGKSEMKANRKQDINRAVKRNADPRVKESAKRLDKHLEVLGLKDSCQIIYTANLHTLDLPWYTLLHDTMSKPDHLVRRIMEYNPKRDSLREYKRFDHPIKYTAESTSKGQLQSAYKVHGTVYWVNGTTTKSIVVDTRPSRLAAAEVKFINMDTRETFNTQSDERGDFKIDLAPGRYIMKGIKPWRSYDTYVVADGKLIQKLDKRSEPFQFRIINDGFQMNISIVDSEDHQEPIKPPKPVKSSRVKVRAKY